MYVHANDKINVLSMTKCGHTAMAKYFSESKKLGEPSINFDLWKQQTQNRVVVLRHPVERMHSAIGWYDKMYGQSIRKYDQTGIIDRHGPFELNKFIRSKDRDHDMQTAIFYGHCLPYMHNLTNTDFKIIKFEDLIKYIPYYSFIVTDTTNRDIDPFPENKYFSKEDLLREIDLYNQFLERDIITPEEWKELTND